MIYHMSFALYIKDNQERISYALTVAQYPRRYECEVYEEGCLTEDQIALQTAYA